MTSLFTFYHCLLSAIIFCHFHVIGVNPYPTFTLPYLVSSYLSLPYILPYLTSYLTFHYLTLYLTLPYICLTLRFAFCYLILRLTLPYLLPYICFALPYILTYLTSYFTFCPTLHFARPYLTLRLTLPYLTSYLKVCPHYAARHTAAKCGKDARQKLCHATSICGRCVDLAAVCRLMLRGLRIRSANCRSHQKKPRGI